ncbi:hypothetical protein GCM10009087_05060 [Sphingomonas oligophenolica]|uniref:Uncharacterized protein n=1 Tax=Sphingomonas oligophenolica TaxID=301154 RepID=A0ABU9YCB7_9SPHN
MENLTITITEAADESGYLYDVYACDAHEVVEGMESEGGGLCTGEIEDALKMAVELAQRVMFRSRIDVRQKGTPLEGTETCKWCGKDVFPDAEGKCLECELPTD